MLCQAGISGYIGASKGLRRYPRIEEAKCTEDGEKGTEDAEPALGAAFGWYFRWQF
jgi:hypothetical protein